MRRLSPWVAATANFFFPGLGFVYSRKAPLILIGALMFLASLHPYFSIFTIPSLIGTALIAFQELTLPRLVTAFSLSLLWGGLGYIAAEFTNRKSTDGYSGGVVLGFMTGFIALLQTLFAFTLPMPYAAWYLGGFAIGVLVILGTWIASREHRLLGGFLVLLASFAFPLEFVFMLLPYPIEMRAYYQPFAVGSGWLTFGIIGGILIIRARSKIKT